MRRALLIDGGSLVVAAAAVLFLGGCAANGGHRPHSYMQGMTCPKCETVWVAPKPGPGANPKIQAMQWGRETACPDCDAMAKAYFKDGEPVLHECPTCKVTPLPAKSVGQTPTRPQGTHI